MPVEIYWEAEKALKHIQFLMASGEPKSETQVEVKNLYRLLAPFCVDEAQRISMIDRARD